MFEHLDDPRPPVLGESFRRAAVERGRRVRRRIRLVRGAGLVLATLLVGTAGLYGRAAWRADDIERVDVAGTDDVVAGEPVTVLVVGTDSRGATADSKNTDSVMLARIDPEGGTASVLSLPRDLMVAAPDGAGDVPINSVAGTGGLDGLVGVVETQVGVPVDHVVEIDLDGFRSLVDRLGGVDVRVDVPVRDTASGLHLDRPGCVTLDGEQALALVRSRKIEVLDASGTWVHDPLSDLRRVETQRQLLIALLDDLAAESVDPVTLNDHVDWAVEHLAVDSALGADELVALARAAAALDPERVSSATLPTLPYPRDVNRLTADPEAAPATVAAFVAGEPLPGGAGPGGPPSPEALPGGAVVDPC